MHRIDKDWNIVGYLYYMKLFQCILSNKKIENNLWLPIKTRLLYNLETVDHFSYDNTVDNNTKGTNTKLGWKLKSTCTTLVLPSTLSQPLFQYK